MNQRISPHLDTNDTEDVIHFTTVSKINRNVIREEEKTSDGCHDWCITKATKFVLGDVSSERRISCLGCLFLFLLLFCSLEMFRDFVLYDENHSKMYNMNKKEQQ